MSVVSDGVAYYAGRTAGPSGAVHVRRIPRTAEGELDGSSLATAGQIDAQLTAEACVVYRS